MAAVRILVITSNLERLHIVVLESVAVGCPIIATTIGSILEVLSLDSVWIMRVGDDAARVRALSGELSNALRVQVLAAANSALFRSYAHDVMCRRLLGLYERPWRAHGWI